MATEELRDLRHRYKAAYTTYMHSVQAVSDASQAGVWPPEGIRLQEEQAFQELSDLRQSLLDALYAHSLKADAEKGGASTS